LPAPTCYEFTSGELVQWILLVAPLAMGKSPTSYGLQQVAKKVA